MIKPTDKSLKKRNQPTLIIFLSIHVILLGIAIVGIEKVSTLADNILKGDFSILTKVVAVPAVAGLALGLLSWTVPKAWKETLVFWHSGPRRLPSSEAFTKIAAADLRIDVAELAARLGELPTDNQKQSALWYATYRKHCNETPVEDANSAYLLYREMAALMPLLLIVVIIFGPVLHAGWSNLGIAFIGLIAEFCLIISAARNAGSRLVANVLALESARPHKSEPKTEPHLPVMKSLHSEHRLFGLVCALLCCRQPQSVVEIVGKHGRQVIGSVHSHMNLEPAEMTDRLLRALECPSIKIMGHPTGRLLLHREPFRFDFERVVDQAVQRDVWLEINASPERLDLNPTMLRQAKARGARFTISTDAHHPKHLLNMRYGVTMARRAWLGPEDILNTKPVAEFAEAIR